MAREYSNMFIDSRDEARRFFVEVWRKRGARVPLSPLEAIVARAIEQHPEYHALLADGERAIGGDFGGDGTGHNPFLHMGLHVALAEQIGADRPRGIASIYRRLCAHDDPHAVEHRMIECLAEALWLAQRAARPPDEAAYLEALRDLT